jgi:hypothetical protein
VNAFAKCRPVVAIALLAALLMLGACAGRIRPVWEPDGGSLTDSQVDALAAGADVSAASGVALEDAPDVRTDVLVWLRSQGADGDRAASLLTAGFPDRTAAVPLYVEIAQVDGVRSLIVVEAAGAKDGTLGVKRLWLFEMLSGRLVRSKTFQ